MDTLAPYLAFLRTLSESGRAISASNRGLIEQIKARATALPHQPQSKAILDLCEQLLSADLQEAEGAALADVTLDRHAATVAGLLLERSFTAQQRRDMAKSGEAMADGSYPIASKADLSNAIHAIGRGSGSHAAIKAHIIKRARALGAVSMLPEDWNVTEAGSSQAATGAPTSGGDPGDTDGYQPGGRRKARRRAKAGGQGQEPRQAAKSDTTVGTPMVEAAELSFADVTRRVEAELQEEYGPTPPYPGYEGPTAMPCRVEALYVDRVVFANGDGLWEAPYTIDAQGEVTLGDAYEVIEAYARLGESATTSIVQLLEKQDPEGREWDVLLIRTGLSENRRYYPADVLRKAAPLFEGTYAYADHATDRERVERPERSIRDKVGKFVEVRYATRAVRGVETSGLFARFKVIAPWLREVLLESERAGEPDFIGFSIDAAGTVSRREYQGKPVEWVEAIHHVNSTDCVTTPAAGGSLVRLVASSAGPRSAAAGEGPVDREEIKNLIAASIAEAMAAASTSLVEAAKGAVATAAAPGVEQATAIAEELQKLQESRRLFEGERRIGTALAEAKVSDVSKERIRSTLMEALKRRDVADDELTAAITEAQTLEAKLLEHLGGAGRPLNVGPRLRMGDDGWDKLDKGFQGFWRGQPVDGVPPFRDLKEAYCRWKGVESWDFDFIAFANDFGASYDSHTGHKQVRESLSTSSWGNIFADHLYIQLMKEYQQAPEYNQWRAVVSEIAPVPDFQTRHWARTGGYGNLSSVAEQGTYQNFASPTDQEITFAITKRGNLDDITFEMLVGDRLNKVRRMPQEMAYAASRTLYRFVMDLVTTGNPTLDYDTTALYHANHANTGTTALTLSGWNTLRIAMKHQTRFGTSAEILGERNEPKIVVVPTELEQLAKRIFNPGPSGAYILTPSADTDASIDPNAFSGLGVQVIVYNYLTDVNDYFAVADPNRMDTMIMGFLGGAEDPELFVQDMPNVGSMFNADKITYKVRHIYGGDVGEHRSFYRMVVA